MDVPGHVSILPAVIDSALPGKVYIYYQYIVTLRAFEKYPNASVVKLQFGPTCTLIVARNKALIKDVLVKKYKVGCLS